MLERIPRRAIDFCAGRAIDSIVVIKAEKAVVNRIEELMAQGGVPLVYADHQGHADGMAFAKLSGYFKKLAAKVHSDFRGFVAPMAASWASGNQGRDLKQGYELMRGAGEAKGFIGIPTTRRKDVVEHGMSRERMLAEVLPFVKKLREGYGICDLPEGSVEGGRHSEGTSIEDIRGMQRVTDDNLTGFYKLAKKAEIYTCMKPFFVPVGLHGSFRLIESPSGGLAKPKFTRQGILSLLMGVLGIPFGLAKIKATVLMPFTEEEIIHDLGPNWKENVLGFNDYAMRRLKPGLPPQAWGYYGREQITNQATQAIEVSQPS